MDTPCEPVGLIDIAKRLGVEQNTASQWRLRPQTQFPEPAWFVSGVPAWNWPDVEEWAKRTGRLT